MFPKCAFWSWCFWICNLSTSPYRQLPAGSFVSHHRISVFLLMLLRFLYRTGVKSTSRHDRDRFDGSTSRTHHARRTSVLGPIVSSSSVTASATTRVLYKNASSLYRPSVSSSHHRKSLPSSRRPSVTRGRTSISDELLSKYKDNTSSHTQGKGMCPSFQDDELDALASQVGGMSLNTNDKIEPSEAYLASSTDVDEISSHSYLHRKTPHSSTTPPSGLEYVHSRFGDTRSLSKIVDPSASSAHAAESQQSVNHDIRLYGLDNSVQRGTFVVLYRL